MTNAFQPRRWRRGLAKTARRPVRAVRRFRPSPVVGALLLGAVLCTAAAAGAAVAAGEQGPAPAASSSTFHGHPGMDPMFGGWDGGDHRH